MFRFVLNRTEFVLCIPGSEVNMTRLVLYMTRFVLHMSGMVLNMTVFVLNVAVFVQSPNS